MNLTEILQAIGGYAAAFGLAVVGLSGWIGGIIAGRIARRETDAISRRAREHEDALVRRRNVYSKLATAMRVFHESSAPKNDKEAKAHELAVIRSRADFMAAYDESCVWASEPVCEQVGHFLDTMMQLSNDNSTDAMKAKKHAYVACILAMRKDSGFPNSKFQFRFVRF